MNIVEQKESKLVEVNEELIIDYLENLGNNLPDHHKRKFIHIAKTFQLNPFIREIYGIPYGNNFNIIVGYEVYIKRAERSGQLAGWRAWTEGNGSDLKGCIEIRRKDWQQPFYHEVYFDEYNQNNNMWKSKPRTMIKKVAIAQGFRLAFPVELGGIPYTADEIDLSKNAADNENETIATVVEAEVSNSTERSIEEIKTAIQQLGLEIEEKAGWLAIIGNVVKHTKIIKSLGFKWFPNKKLWAKQIA